MKKLLITLISFFLFLNQIFSQPIITSISPENGSTGFSNYISIHGRNFGNTTSNLKIYFGGCQGIVWGGSNDTLLRVSASGGSTFNKICVTNINTGLTGCSAQPYNVTFPCGGAVDSNFFTTKITLNSGALYPWDVALGDFDRNGKIDIATINAWNKVLDIHRNESTIGSIQFSSRSDINTKEDGTYRLAVGDIDADGKLDIAVSNTNSNQISIFRNTSSFDSISFDTPVFFASGLNPQSIQISDIDLDGKPDVIIANRSGNSISILKNTSIGYNISFNPKVDFSVGFDPYQMAIGDLNNDGKIDIATANVGNNISNVTLLENKSTPGNILFANKVTLNHSSRMIAIADLNNDMQNELILQYDKIKVFKNVNSSTLNFLLVDSLETNGTAEFIAVANIDGDDKPEIIIATNSKNNISVYKNNSTINNINFNSKVDISVGKSPYGIAIGDIDGDDKPEIIVPNSQDHNLTLLKNITKYSSHTINPQTICEGESYQINGKIYSSTGTYIDTLHTFFGCDSIIITQLTQNAKPQTPTIEYSNDTLKSNMASGNQWYNQNGILTGANDQYYIPQINGSYFAINFRNGCSSDSSNTISITKTGISELSPLSSIKIYPNPASDKLTIEIPSNKAIKRIILRSILGVELELISDNNKEVRIPDYVKTGYYFIYVDTDEGSSKPTSLSIIK